MITELEFIRILNKGSVPNYEYTEKRMVYVFDNSTYGNE